MCVRTVSSTAAIVNPNINESKVNDVKTQENNNVTNNNTTETKSEAPTQAASQVNSEIKTEDNTSKVRVETTASSNIDPTSPLVSFSPVKAQPQEKLNVNAFSIDEDEIGFNATKIEDSNIKDSLKNEFKVDYDKFEKPEDALKNALDKATNAAKAHEGIEAIVSNYSKDGKVESYSIYKATQSDVDNISKLSSEGKYNGKVARFVTPSSIFFIGYEKNTDIKSGYVFKPKQETTTPETKAPSSTAKEPNFDKEISFGTPKESDIVVTRPNNSNPNLGLNLGSNIGSSNLYNPNKLTLSLGNPSIDSISGNPSFNFTDPTLPLKPNTNLYSLDKQLTLNSPLLNQQSSLFSPWTPSLSLYEPYGFSLFSPFDPSLYSLGSSPSSVADPASPQASPSKLTLKDLTIGNSEVTKKYMEDMERSATKNFSDLSNSYINESKELFAKNMQKYADPKYDSLIKNETLKGAVAKLRTGESFSDVEINNIANVVKNLPKDKLTTEQKQAVQEFETLFSDFQGKMEVLKQSSQALESQLKEQSVLLGKMSEIVASAPDGSPVKKIYETFLAKATQASERKPPNAYELLTNNAMLNDAMNIINGQKTVNLEEAKALQGKVVSFMESRLAELPEDQKSDVLQQINAIKSIDPNSIVGNKDTFLSLYIASTAEFEMNVFNIAKGKAPDANKQISDLTRSFFGSSIDSKALDSIVRTASSSSNSSASNVGVAEEHSSGGGEFGATFKAAATNAEGGSADFSSFTTTETVPSTIVDTTNKDSVLQAETLSTTGTIAALTTGAKFAAGGGDISGNVHLKNSVGWIGNLNARIEEHNSNLESSNIGSVSANFTLSKPLPTITRDFTDTISTFASLSQEEFSSPKYSLTSYLAQNNEFLSLGREYKTSTVDFSSELLNFSENLFDFNNFKFEITSILQDDNSFLSRLGRNADVYGSFLQSKIDDSNEISQSDIALTEISSDTVQNAEALEASLAVIDDQFSNLAGVASISNLLERFRDIIVELDLNTRKTKDDTTTRNNIDVSHARKLEEFKRHLKALDRSRAENNKDFRSSKQVIAAMVPKIKDPKDQMAMAHLVDILAGVYSSKPSSAIY